jgi:hypothetical protein
MCAYSMLVVKPRDRGTFGALKSKTHHSTSAKINTRNHLLQWYEVQDNTCSDIFSYNDMRGCDGARLQRGLPNGDFARSCGLDSRKEVEPRGRKQVLCFHSISSLTIMSCHQFTNVSSHLSGMDSILRGPLGLPLPTSLSCD